MHTHIHRRARARTHTHRHTSISATRARKGHTQSERKILAERPPEKGAGPGETSWRRDGEPPPPGEAAVCWVSEAGERSTSARAWSISFSELTLREFEQRVRAAPFRHRDAPHE